MEGDFDQGSTSPEILENRVRKGKEKSLVFCPLIPGNRHKVRWAIRLVREEVKKILFAAATGYAKTTL